MRSQNRVAPHTCFHTCTHCQHTRKHIYMLCVVLLYPPLLQEGIALPAHSWDPRIRGQKTHTQPCYFNLPVKHKSLLPGNACPFQFINSLLPWAEASPEKRGLHPPTMALSLLGVRSRKSIYYHFCETPGFLIAMFACVWGVCV